MRIVVCYDVVTNKRRRRLASRLTGFIQRVQKSVFEGRVPSKKMEHLRAAAKREIDLKTDSVRIYHLCARCLESVEVIGTGSSIPAEVEDVVL